MTECVAWNRSPCDSACPLPRSSRKDVPPWSSAQLPPGLLMRCNIMSDAWGAVQALIWGNHSSTQYPDVTSAKVSQLLTANGTRIQARALHVLVQHVRERPTHLKHTPTKGAGHVWEDHGACGGEQRCLPARRIHQDGICPPNLAESMANFKVRPHTDAQRAIRSPTPAQVQSRGAAIINARKLSSVPSPPTCGFFVSHKSLRARGVHLHSLSDRCNETGHVCSQGDLGPHA